jgi:F-type H+-transporting ATPase subunit epsilon
MALQLLVVTPERKVVEADADEVELPGAEGYVGILPGHAPMITLLGTGVLTIRRGGSSTAYAVSAGFAEVLGDRVSVLADSAQGAAEIDAPAAEREGRRRDEDRRGRHPRSHPRAVGAGPGPDFRRPPSELRFPRGKSCAVGIRRAGWAASRIVPKAV